MHLAFPVILWTTRDRRARRWRRRIRLWRSMIFRCRGCAIMTESRATARTDRIGRRCRLQVSKKTTRTTSKTNAAGSVTPCVFLCPAHLAPCDVFLSVVSKMSMKARRRDRIFSRPKLYENKLSTEVFVDAARKWFQTLFTDRRKSRRVIRGMGVRGRRLKMIKRC